MNTFKLVEPEEVHAQHYRTDLPVYAYIRFSSMGQVKNSLQSKKQQDQRMQEKLVRIGFTDIRVKDQDEGMSAQKGLEKRADLADIYRAMKAGECAAIAAFDASRLWRDRDRVHFNDFIMKIKLYDVPVILHNRTYWPKIKDDMEALRVEFEYSQKALDQFYEKAGPARQEAVLSGSYGGHAIPVGYVVVGEKGEKKYVIYEPHAKLIRWLFKRYKELSGNLGRLFRELTVTDFHFPDFDKDALRAMEADRPHIALQHDAKGYKLQTRGGLRSMLTNRAYIGWYVYNAASTESRVFQGEFINRDSHKAIVDYEDFIYAYMRLSSVNLDGQANESKPKVNRLYGMSVQALLENILENNGTPCYAMARENNYVARTVNNDATTTGLVVSINTLDAAIDHAVQVLLIALEQRHKEGLQDVLHAQLTALQQEKQAETDTLDTALQNVDRAIAGWELDKASSRETGNKKGLDDANRRLTDLYATRAMLVEKHKKTGHEEEEIEKTRSLLDQAVANWHGMTFESKQLFMRLLVSKVNIQDVTPHILKIDIVLKEPFSATMTGHVYRRRGSKPTWTDEEIATLKALYPNADRAAILEALPVRAWISIMQQAMSLGLSRSMKLNTSDLDEAMTVADRRYMKAHYLRTDAPVWELPNVDIMLATHRAIDAHNAGMARSRKEEGLVLFR